MDLQRNLRVLPSNAPALPENTGYESSTLAESPDTLLPHICQNFNNGLGCKSCYNLHLCLNCRQHDHGAFECKNSVLQVTSGNAGVNALTSRHIGSDLGSPQACGFENGALPLDVPIHTVSVASRYEQPRRHTRRSEHHPNYWHVEFNTPRYRAYREKCRQKGSREKWPDRVEEAFQIGIYKIMRCLLLLNIVIQLYESIEDGAVRRKFCMANRVAGTNGSRTIYIRLRVRDVTGSKSLVTFKF